MSARAQTPASSPPRTQAPFDLWSSRLWFAAVMLLYLLFLRYSYVDVIAYSAVFKYSGAIALEPVEFAPGAALIVSVLPLVWIRTSLERPSDQIVFYFYAFVYVPACALMPYLTQFSFLDQIGFLLLMALFLGALELRRLIKLWPVADFAITDRGSYLVGIGGASLAASGVLFWFGEISFGDITNFDVYERRSALLAGGGSTLIFYLANWSALALAPAALVCGLRARSLWVIAAAVVLAVFAFAATSFKSHMFIPLLSGLVYLALERFGAKRMGLILLGGFWSISALALIIDALVNYAPYLTWAFQFRMIGNNGFLVAEYFDFFYENPKGLFADSIGAIFFDPVYTKPIAQIVGESFSAVAGNHANANFLADGYGNAGAPGMAFAAAEALAFIWLADSLGARKDVRVIAAILVPASFNFANTAVHSTLTSNGGLLLLLLIALLPAESPEPGTLAQSHRF